MTEEDTRPPPTTGPPPGPPTGPPTGPPPGPPTGPPPGPPGAYPPLAALRRSRTDRKLFGVAGGLGRYAGVDPLVFRILFVVLAFFGGSGLLLYALAWLLVADDGESESEGQRLLHGRTDRSTVSTVVAGVVALVLGLVLVATLFDTGAGHGGLGALVVVSVLVVLLIRNGQRPALDPAPHAPAYGPVPPPEPGAYGQTPGTAYAANLPPGPPGYPLPAGPLPPPTPKEKSVLGRVTLSAALIVAGLMVGWNSTSDDDFKVMSVFAAALAVVALGLLVGAFAGRARWLIGPAVLLTIATGISHAADLGFGSGVGERTWEPTTVAEAQRPFRLGVGEAELNLTGLPAGSVVEVDVRLGVGELRVIVPAGARVAVDGDVGAGTLKLLDEESLDGTDLHDSTTSPGQAGSGTRITIDAEVGLGDLEVRR